MTLPSSPLHIFSRLLIMAAVLGLAACSRPAIVAEYPDKPSESTLERTSIFDNFKRNEGSGSRFSFGLGGGSTTTLNVNSDLWQAALDSLAFLPLASANPDGGVIITDWYEDTTTTNAQRTRSKINVLIVGRDLRADSLRVSVFRQRRDGNEWRALSGNDTLSRQLENVILARARDFKLRRASQ